MTELCTALEGVVVEARADFAARLDLAVLIVVVAALQAQGLQPAVPGAPLAGEIEAVLIQIDFRAAFLFPFLFLLISMSVLPGTGQAVLRFV